MLVRVLIIDDDLQRRTHLCQLISADTDAQIVGECGGDQEAESFLRDDLTDIVFFAVSGLDINGFDFTKITGAENNVFLVFVSDSDRTAAKAFELGALDYLIAPLTAQRLDITLGRARRQMQIRSGADLEKRLQSLIDNLNGKNEYPEKLMLKTAKGVYFVKTSEIDWIEAAGNYINLHIGESSHLLRETMNNIETKLDPERFLRIHRSSLVNIDRIKELQPLFNGDYIVILDDRTELNLSRSYHDRLQKLFERYS